MPEFSIIVPVYNAERSLTRCLNSIQRQKYSDFEVILVDDGSTDKSNIICREFVQEDERFKLLDQENSGPSVARNRGLNLAQGKYIAFVDSDDYLENDYLNLIKEKFEKADIGVVFIGFHKITQDGSLISKHILSDDNLDYHSKLLELSTRDMFGYTWVKVFKREVIGSSIFREDLNLFEDEIFTCQVLNNCCQVGVVEQAIYNYTVGNASALTGKTHMDYCQKREQVFQAWKTLLVDYKNKEEALIQLANIALKTCQFYYLERNIKSINFINELAMCEFIKYAKIEDDFIAKVLKKAKSKRKTHIEVEYDAR